MGNSYNVRVVYELINSGNGLSMSILFLCLLSSPCILVIR